MFSVLKEINKVCRSFLWIDKSTLRNLAQLFKTSANVIRRKLGWGLEILISGILLLWEGMSGLLQLKKTMLG